jgi:hypothetical protein
MDREYQKAKKIDRSNWKSGPWDNEPDYAEWTTAVGYPAWCSRLKSGAWFGVIEAPLPIKDCIGFFGHAMRDKSDLFEHDFGMICPTDQEGIGGYTTSMEHWESPGLPTKTSYRGPYKTLEDLKSICEVIAKNISETHREGTYVNYFNL